MTTSLSETLFDCCANGYVLGQRKTDEEVSRPHSSNGRISLSLFGFETTCVCSLLPPDRSRLQGFFSSRNGVPIQPDQANRGDD